MRRFKDNLVFSNFEVKPSMTEKPQDDMIFGEAVRIAGEAQKRGLPLRLFGACAFRAHCNERTDLLLKFGRYLSDVDFVTYETLRPDVLTGFFKEMGYKSRFHYVWHAQSRQIFYNDSGLNVDVFIGDVEFCHTISFKGRLEADFPAIPLAEMLLEKLQIVKITEKDMKDLIVLLLEHPTGDSDKETVNLKRIAKLLADDWGFYYTATTNLKKLESEYLEKVGLSEEEKSTVKRRINEILSAVEKESKSLKWKMRARVGPQKKWYRDVEEVAR